jgi:hypothetical protein
MGRAAFVFGASMGVLFTIGEAWVNDLAPETRAAAWWRSTPPPSRCSS